MADEKKRVPVQLKLKPPISRFCGFVKPMEPQRAPNPFDSAEHLFQVKWDGVRMLAFKDGEKVSLQNRKGRSRTDQYPELQQLGELVRANDALLDGEVIVMEEGRPSFARVIQRDFCSRESTIKTMARVIRCTYCLFDILYLNGEELTARPLQERLEILSEVVRARPPLYLNENFNEGLALYQRVKDLGLEGIVAKQKESPYLIGQKSASWLKIKPRRRRLCVVGGLALKGGTVGALLLGGYRDNRLYYIGSAAAGLSGHDLLQLRDYAAAHPARESPFVNPPRGGNYTWLEPRLTVAIEFAEWTDKYKLRSPVVAGFTGRPPGEARL